MTKYLLDTSVVAGYLLARQKAIQLVSPLLEQEKAATSMLVYGEVAEYAHHSRKGIGKRGILWHTEKHERRVLFDNRAH